MSGTDFFKILGMKVHASITEDGEAESEVSLKMIVNNAEVHKAADSINGIVDAINIALLRILLPYFPILKELKIIDYNVSTALCKEKGTKSRVEVEIEFSDSFGTWERVGESSCEVGASLVALADGFREAILRSKERGLVQKSA